MNKYKIMVANIIIEIEETNDYSGLWKTGLFEEVYPKPLIYTKTEYDANMWVYRVKLNGKTEIAVIERCNNG